MALGRYHGTSDKNAVGWRTWVWDEEAGLLRSRMSGKLWTPGERFTAACEASHFTRGYYRIAGGEPPAASHAAPDRACECGVSAYKDIKTTGLAAEVTGTVELSGTVIEHEDGFRASHGYPLELAVRADGAAAGDDRAALIAKRLREAYSVRVGTVTHEAVDDAFAQMLRDVPPARGLASIARIAWTARERHDRGEEREALKIVLAELRRRDLWEIHPGNNMAQALPGPFFLHETTRRRWVREIHGGLGRQRLTIASLKGQAPIYYGPQMVELDTRNGGIVERFEGCAGPRHHGHPPGGDARGPDKLTISRIGASLRLETWIQLLLWHADPEVRGHAAGLRRNP